MLLTYLLVSGITSGAMYALVAVDWSSATGPRVT